jgi:hypothetical protein
VTSNSLARSMCVSCGWTGLSIMPNIVVFHDDIASFVAVFGRFAANESDNFLLPFKKIK